MHGFPLSRPAPPGPEAAAPAAGATAPRSRRRPAGSWIFGGGKIRTRILLLSGALLLVLIATNVYLSRKLNENTAGTIETANLLGAIEQANNAQIAFGEMRYWMTDLAVSLLTLSESKAKAAQARTEAYLDELAPLRPQPIAAIRGEVAQYRDLAAQAVDAYTDDQRVIGNTLLAQARQHSIKADELFAAIVAELSAEAACGARSCRRGSSLGDNAVENRRRRRRTRRLRLYIPGGGLDRRSAAPHRGSDERA